MSAKVHVIFRDSDGAYFIRLGLGMFWECSSRRPDAREFKTRAQAAKMLTANGKHLYGWRVLTVPAVLR